MTAHIVKQDEDGFNSWLKKRAGKAAGKLEKMGLDPKDFLNTEVGWLLCLPKYEDKFLDLDPYQLKLLTVKTRRRSLLKSRQVGFSFIIACESIARAHLKEKHVAVCVSYNMDDAKEKITRVRELHEDLPLRFQKKLVIDSKKEIAFQSNSRNRRLSRVISFPSRAPRGKTGDVYLDELAHCQNDKSIYTGATALIVRSGGQLTIGSTPLGKRGQFHAIHSQEFEKYPGYWRQEVPWWLCRQFCNDVPRAVREAPGMSSEQRVHMFGKAPIQDQFGGLTIEDFRQEFELDFQDERVSYYPYSLIMPCATRERELIPIYSDIDSLAAAARKMGVLRFGFDVGRTKHPSELYIFEKTPNGKFIERYSEQFLDTPFPEQRARLTKIGELLNPFLDEFRIDQTGLGRNLSEDLQRNRVFGKKVIGVQFTMKEKEKLASSFKILLQAKGVVLGKDRNTVSQIHSIKQKITASGNTIFDAEKNRKHHADKFWAIAMATYEDRTPKKRYVIPVATVRLIGEKPPPEPGAVVEPVKHESLLEKVFALPNQETPPKEPTNRAVIKNVSNEALRQKANDLRIAIKIWEKSGDEEKVLGLKSQYLGVMRYLKSRAK